MISALTAIVYTTALSAGLLVGDGTHRAAALLVVVLLLARTAARRTHIGEALSPLQLPHPRRTYAYLLKTAFLPVQSRTNRHPQSPRGAGL